ncbi:MAG TPA: hypothetical protein EYN71_02610 [Flavobacteriales bacterium]|nr:hypothetical protein [Flavobacteriales bacterium]HIO66946.1 hypothetical protein [Flavobacteriales bacterium]
MPSFLKNHPFGVEAFFESSTVLAFAVPKEELEPLIPESLALDLFEAKWAFVAVAMVETSGLRPKGFPKIFGRDFFLIGYRIFVKYRTSAGKRLRGLYIIRSETDKRSMGFFGNLFTHYNYNQTDINIEKKEGHKIITSEKSNFVLDIQENQENISLPKDSPFPSWKEARRYAGPLPFTFTYNERKREMLIIEGVRSNWEPKPLKVNRYRSEYIESLALKDIVLANAFVVNQIPYYWKKGKTDPWKKEENFKGY